MRYESNVIDTCFESLFNWLLRFPIPPREGVCVSLLHYFVPQIAFVEGEKSSL